MDDEIIHSWCFHDVECFDSTLSAAIIILDRFGELFEPQIPAISTITGGKFLISFVPDIFGIRIGFNMEISILLVDEPFTMSSLNVLKDF